MYLMNSLMPMSYGDDYVYSFVWDGSNGWNIYQPLPEDAKRVESFGDLWQSLCSYYMTWGGRIPATVLSQFFLWQGKGLFNFCNSVIFIVLILEIYYISVGGKITAKLQPFRLLWIFFALWTFVLGFNGIMFWLVGACYYLWTMVMVLAFLIPYVRRYMAEETEVSENGKEKSIAMFLVGLLAGCTNENMVCWLILLLAVYCWRERKERRLSPWMISGLLGMVIGYAALIFAPGNLSRIFYDVQEADMQTIEYKLQTLLGGVLFQIFLWFMVAIAWRKKENFGQNEQTKKKLCLIQFGRIGSAGMLLIMLLSPEFPLRSIFSSTVFLIVTATIVLDLEQVTGESVLRAKLKKFLGVVGTVYMIWSIAMVTPAFYKMYCYAKDVDGAAQCLEASGSGKMLELPFREKNFRSCSLVDVHISAVFLDTDENHWKNVAYARYWGIQGVRMKKR